jgi:hypothetical protein
MCSAGVADIVMYKKRFPCPGFRPLGTCRQKTFSYSVLSIIHGCLRNEPCTYYTYINEKKINIFIYIYIYIYVCYSYMIYRVTDSYWKNCNSTLKINMNFKHSTSMPYYMYFLNKNKRYSYLILLKYNIKIFNYLIVNLLNFRFNLNFNELYMKFVYSWMPSHPILRIIESTLYIYI